MREISKRRHLIVFTLTFLIFTIGLMLGLLVTKEREEALENINKIENLKYDSLQLQHLYMTSLAEEKDCVGMLSSLEENVKELEGARERIENYIKDSKTNKNSYIEIKREYTLAQLRYWLFVRKYRDICDGDFVSILYFYSNSDECTECRTQGIILTYLKSLLKDRILTFSFDADFEDEPMIKTLKKVYNITEVPIVIIENTKFSGLIELDELKKEICSWYKFEISECEDVM